MRTSAVKSAVAFVLFVFASIRVHSRLENLRVRSNQIQRGEVALQVPAIYGG
jgi:hypothetical protein